MDSKERFDLIQWLVINLPGGPEIWREHLPHVIGGLAGYSTSALRELKEYAVGQIEQTAREKAHFEKLLAELSKRLNSTFQIEPTRCPFCNKLIEGATDPEFQGVKPFPGGYCVCLDCGRISVFDENLKLRKLTTREGIQMPLEVRAKADRIKAAIQRSKQRSKARYN